MFRSSFRLPAMLAVLAVAAVLIACGGSGAPASSVPAAAATAAPAVAGIAAAPEGAASAATTTPAAQTAGAGSGAAIAAATAVPTAAAAAAGASPATAPAMSAAAVPGGESCGIASADLTFDDRPPQGGTLVRLSSDPPTLDPHLTGDVTSSAIVHEVFGGLVTLGLDYQPALDLAESCVVSGDGVVYTFTLRENARFHNGRPVTAQDVKWSIERAADPATLSNNAQNYLGDILGVVEKLNGNASEVSGVRVIDDRTIELTIDAPKAYFLAKLSYPTAFVLDREQVSDDDSWLDQPNGTGPFRLGTYDIGELIILERNELYHLGPPHVASVHMILRGGTAMIMYENDEIHVTGVGLDDLPRLLDPNDPLNPELNRSPQDFDVFYIGLNVDVPPFDDVKVRQAMNYAIDLEAIAENVLDGRVSPARGVIPPGFPSYNENLTGYSYDPDRARQLLQESGYGDAMAAGDFPRVTLSISGSFGAAIPSYLEVMLEQWRQELGIEIDIQQTEWATFLQDVNDREYQMFVLGWVADYPDPENFLDLLFRTGSQNNNTNYSNPEVDRLLAEAAVELDRERRFEIYNRVEQMVLDEAPWVWTWFSGEGYALIKPQVSDYFLLQMSIPKYRYIYFNQ